MWRPLIAVLAVATSVGSARAEGPAKTEAERFHERAELMRDPDTLVVDDASPLEKSKVQGELDFASRPYTGESGVVMRPEVRLGLPLNLEIGAGADVETGGAAEPTSAAASAHLIGQVLEEKGARPALALQGEVESPQGDAGVSAEARVLATKSFGTVQVHGNAAYRARRDTEDDYLLTVGADSPLDDKWLLQGGAYYVSTLGPAPDNALGLDMGASFLLGQKVVLSGTVGLNSREGNVAPRMVLGIMGQL